MIFSVIIPAYNSSAYLKETINSLASQTFRDFEVIVVDDHSEDDSFFVAQQSLSVAGIDGFAIRKSVGLSKGVSSTRNFGAQQAKGDWLIFLDSDDIFHPLKLEVIKKCIDSNTQCMAIYHHYIIPNSSFAWWAVWMNRSTNKIVVAPKVWFTDTRWDPCDLIPDAWIRIEN